MDQQGTKHFVNSVGLSAVVGRSCGRLAGATPFSYLEEVVKKVTQLGISKAH